jgi:hypothetical protein
MKNRTKEGAGFSRSSLPQNLYWFIPDSDRLSYLCFVVGSSTCVPDVDKNVRPDFQHDLCYKRLDSLSLTSKSAVAAAVGALDGVVVAISKPALYRYIHYLPRESRNVGKFDIAKQLSGWVA